MPKRISLWMVWGWFLATVLDLFLPHPHAYLADPISGSVLVSLAISAAVTAASTGLAYLQAKRQKVAPVDRGKLDDIRASVPGYGEFIPKGWGTFRIAPIWIWESPAVDHPVTTAGKSGGKSPKPPTPTTTEHVYVKSVAGVFHDGEIYGGVRRMWFDNDLVFNGLTSAAAGGAGGGEISSEKYEAEFGAFSGGAAAATQSECSGGKKVTGIGNGGKCTIKVKAPFTDDYELAVHYTSTTDLTYKIYIDGSLLGDLDCPASGGAGIVSIETWPGQIPLTAGTHLIRFENSGAACPDLDYIDFVGSRSTSEIDTRSFSSVIDPSKIPATDQNHSWSYNNFQPDVGDGSGAGGAAGTPFQTFTLSGYGQPTVRIYRGTQTQNADSAIVAQEGSANASAYRGFAYLVIEGLQLQNGRVPNVTLEVEQGIHSVPAIVTDIYNTVGITQLDVSALAGLSLGDSDIDPGTYVDITYANTANETHGAGGAIHKTSGANHAWNAYAAGNTSIASGDDGAVRFTADVGPVLIGLGADSSPTVTTDMLAGILLNTTSYPSLETKNAIQFWNGTTQSPDIGVWAPGDQFQIEERNGRIRVYQNGIEIQSFTPPVLTYPLYPQIMMYDTGAGVSALTVSTSGAIGDAPSSDAGGLLLSSRRTAAELLGDLQTRFQFDMVEVDGVVKAILRNGSSADIAIPYTDMRAVIAPEGQLPEVPAFDCEIHDIDLLLLPERVDVNYLDPGEDYHNNVQSEMVLEGVPRLDNQSVSLAIVDQADNMKKLAITLMHKAEMEGRSFNFQTSYKYLHVHPGSIATITLPNATHTVRITQARYQLPCGVIEFQGVRQAASVYSPSATGSGSSGFEAPIAPIPANTKGVIIDGPVLRPEDAGDGTSPVLYRAMCGRGSGAWSGAYEYQEFPIGSGNYQLVQPNAVQQSQIGVTSGALADYSDPSVWDRSSTLIVDFYTNTTLSSETEADLLSNPNLNLLAVINPSTNRVEYVQFKTAVAGTPTAPYLSRYTVSTFLRGRAATENNTGTHTSADDVVLMHSTVVPIRANLGDVGRTINYKFVSSGQTLEDVPVVSQRLNGVSLLPLSSVSLRGERDSDGDLYIKWRRRSRLGPGLRPGSDVPLGEEKELYIVRVMDGVDEVRKWFVATGTAMAAVLNSDSTSSKFDWVDHNTLTGAAWPAVHQAGSIQTIDQSGNFVQGTLVSAQTDTPESWLGLIPANASWQGQAAIQGSMPTVYDTSYLVSLTYNFGLRVYDHGSLVYTDGTITTRARIHILLSGSEVRFYKDYVGLGSLPFYVSPIAPTFPYRAFASVRGVSSVEGILLTTDPVPGTVYSVDQQTEDFGSPQNPLTVRVSQVSAVSGEGDFIEENI